jgi:hypothetical protein
MIRLAPGVWFLFQAVFSALCLRCQGFSGPFFATPQFSKMTKFVIWKPSLASPGSAPRYSQISKPLATARQLLGETKTLYRQELRA